MSFSNFEAPISLLLQWQCNLLISTARVRDTEMCTDNVSVTNNINNNGVCALTAVCPGSKQRMSIGIILDRVQVSVSSLHTLIILN